MLKPSPKKRVLFFLLSDIVLSLFTLFLAYQLRFSFDVGAQYYIHFINIFLFLTILKLIFLAYFRIYRVVWKFFSLVEAKKLVYAHLLAYISFFIVFLIFKDEFIPFPRSILIIDFVLSLMFIGVLRLSKRLILEGNNNHMYKNTLIVGVSSIAQTIIKDDNNYSIVSIVDNIPMVVGSYFSSIKVRPFFDIEDIIKQYTIESVIIVKKLEKKELNKLYKILTKLEIYDIKIISIDNQEEKLKDLSVTDLLARTPKDLDLIMIEDFIKDKTILITGAGGSIGSELSRQSVKYGAKKLILLDHSEYNLYQINEELDSSMIIPVMLSVTCDDDLEQLFSLHKPQIVIHAAAYKHVPLVEANITQAIKNNILGTKNVIDLAIKYNAQKCLLISTDKAVRPTNVMGTTKRICELYAQNIDSNGTDIVAVRFGNVLGSSGSVIPKFQKQIDEGGPITVTHRDITRYFMLIPEACELVLQAASIGEGDELFILDMGEPIKIVELAKKMIELSGKKIDIEFTGLRPGEKLYEELLIDDSDKSTQYESIFVAKQTKYDINLLKKQIDELLSCENKLAKLKEIVPEFKHNI